MQNTPESPEMKRYALQQQVKTGANWFYWIAGFSVVNSVAWRLKSGWGFAAALSSTQVLDGLSSRFGTVGLAVSLIPDLFLVVVFVVIGRLARTNATAFKVGLALYALDAIPSLLFRDFWGLGFHALALAIIYRGLVALNALAAEPGSLSASMAQPSPALATVGDMGGEEPFRPFDID